jgi:hypothetical protein
MRLAAKLAARFHAAGGACQWILHTSGPHICSRKAPRHILSAAKLWAIRMRRSTPPFDRCFGAASRKAKDEVRARDMGESPRVMCSSTLKKQQG